MAILQKDAGKDGRFYVAQNNKILAEMIDTCIATVGNIIRQTVVDDSLAGMGIGKQ